MNTQLFGVAILGSLGSRLETSKGISLPALDTEMSHRDFDSCGGASWQSKSANLCVGGLAAALFR